jgi:hypothetical protein
MVQRTNNFVRTIANRDADEYEPGDRKGYQDAKRRKNGETPHLVQADPIDKPHLREARLCSHELHYQRMLAGTRRSTAKPVRIVETGRRFESIKAATDAIDGAYTTSIIHSITRGTRAAGYHWEYA